MSLKPQTRFTIFPHLLCISEPYSAICLDAYGVFWNGNQAGPLPGSIKTMELLVANGKQIGIFSNSTQLAEREVEKMKKFGLIQDRHFHFFITSGQIARDLFLNQDLPFKIRRKKYWVFCGNHPKLNPHYSLFENTAYTEAQTLQEADFIYVGIPHLHGEDQTDPLKFKDEVDYLKQSCLPMVCANPDRFAHEGNPPQAVVRQGSIASLYEEGGGQVFYIGKPSLLGFQRTEELFKTDNILMVGDTPETDIRGANSSGWNSALVIKTGNMADRIAKKGLEASLDELPNSDKPTHLIEQMASHEF